MISENTEQNYQAGASSDPTPGIPPSTALNEEAQKGNALPGLFIVVLIGLVAFLLSYLPTALDALALAIVLGMSISYVASLLGMFIAMWAYKRENKKTKGLVKKQ